MTFRPGDLPFPQISAPARTNLRAGGSPPSGGPERRSAPNQQNHSTRRAHTRHRAAGGTPPAGAGGRGAPLPSAPPPSPLPLHLRRSRAVMFGAGRGAGVTGKLRGYAWTEDDLRRTADKPGVYIKVERDDAYYRDLEAGGEQAGLLGGSEMDNLTRWGFVRKVYGILEAAGGRRGGGLPRPVAAGRPQGPAADLGVAGPGRPAARGPDH